MMTNITLRDGLDKALGRASALLNAACTLAEDERASENLLTLVCMASELVEEAMQHKTQLYAQEVTREERNPDAAL